MGLVNYERVFSLSKFLQAPMPQIDWLIDPLIAHGNRVMFYGESGCGKSWIMLDLALAIAGGKPWLNHYTIPQPRRVLYLDEEMSPTLLQRRIKQLAGEVPEDANVPDTLWFGSHLGIHFTEALNTQALLTDLQANGIDPDVIIADTFRKVFIGNENDAGEVGRFWDSIEPFQTAGKTFIVCHHMKKPSPQGSTGLKHMASGSTNLVGQVDAAYAVSRRSKDTMILECVKSRDTEEPPPFTVGLCDIEDDTPRVELRYLGTKEGPQDNPSRIQQGVECIRELLKESAQESYTTKELNDRLISKGLSEKTAERVRTVCGSQGILEKIGKGLWRRTLLADAA